MQQEARRVHVHDRAETRLVLEADKSKDPGVVCALREIKVRQQVY